MNSGYITKKFHKGANFHLIGMGGNPIYHSLRIYDILFQAEWYMCQNIPVYMKSFLCALVLGFVIQYYLVVKKLTIPLKMTHCLFLIE